MLQTNIKRYALIALGFALLFQLLFSEGGVLGFFKLKRDIKTIDVSMKKLEDDNRTLLKQIDKLQKDDQYLEELARSKGFTREGEILYRVEK
jgi:cell division protein FtsB